MVNLAPGVLGRSVRFEPNGVVRNLAEGSLPFHRILLGRARPFRNLGQSCTWAAVVRTWLPLSRLASSRSLWHKGNPGLLRIIPNTALLPGEVQLRQDHARPGSFVKKK